MMSVANEIRERLTLVSSTFETTDGSSHTAFTWTPPLSSANYIAIVYIFASAKTAGSTKAYWTVWPVPLVWVTSAVQAMGTLAAANSGTNGGFTGSATVSVSAGDVVITVTGEAATTYEWLVYIDASSHKFDRVFSPMSIANCVWWLRADLGVTGSPVTSWADQSGTGNTVTSGTGAAATFNASNANFNGQPTIDFDGTTQGLSRGSASGFGAGPSAYTIVVARRSPTQTAGRIVHVGALNATSPYIALRHVSLNSVEASTGGGSTQYAQVTPYSIINSVTWDGTTGGAGLKLYADTSLANATNAIIIPPAPTLIGVGFSADLAQFANCSIAEIAAYTGVLSASDLLALQNYMMTRYGI